jgi:tRNA threonylcarbamoyladenosine biosynthesis protein TsaE
MIKEVSSEDTMKKFGAQIGALLCGGEIIELVGDVGAGKTTLAKGLAVGLGIEETLQSPSFTISRIYDSPEQHRLAHYDFYRLEDAGIMADELGETLQDPQTITLIEWAGIVRGILPTDHLTMTITSPTEQSRILAIAAGGPRSQKLLEQLK